MLDVYVNEKEVYRTPALHLPLQSIVIDTKYLVSKDKFQKPNTVMKSTSTVVALTAGVVNIVGPLNPLVGTTTPLNNTGFGTLAAYTDSITVYQPGPLSVSTSYVPLGDGTISSDFGTPTTDTISNTTGAVVIPGADTALTLQPGFTVAP